jgi:hypothetical protein
MVQLVSDIQSIQAREDHGERPQHMGHLHYPRQLTEVMGEPQGCHQLCRTSHVISNPLQLIILAIQFVFFIWKNLDLFITMQQYLMFCGSIQCPLFKDVNGMKCQDQYPGTFLTEPTNIFNAMMKVKLPTLGVITTGLWPLDHESYYNW